MRPTCPGPIRCLTLLFALAAVPLAPRGALAQTTTWTGSGDWGTADNWSDGEPTADVDAIVPSAAAPTVTLAGEVCRSLRVGTLGAGGTFRIQGGSLNVVSTMSIGAVTSALFSQTFGTLTAAELWIGQGGNGGATYTGGTQTLGKLRIGTSALSSGTYSMAVTTPVCTIAESLVVARGGSFVCGAGTLTVGTAAGQGARVDGALTINNTPSMHMKGLVMSSTAFLSVGVGVTGTPLLLVDGTAVLAGQLIISDILATNGTYEVVRGNPLQGGFSGATLPPDWSWRVEGNSLLLTKGPVPVQPTTWSTIKGAYTTP